MKPINVFLICNGMGCGQIALRESSIPIKAYYSSEINQHAIKVTQKNFPKTIQLGDVTKIKGKNLPKIDLILAGTPCQGLSRANTKRQNLTDPRSALFFQFVRLLHELKPKYFLLENVVMDQETQDIISEILGVKPILIDSARVSAQHRERLYWSNIPGITQPKNKKITFAEAIGVPGAICGGFHGRKTKTSNGKYLQLINTRTDGKCNCLTTNPRTTLVMKEHVSGKFAHEVEHRFLTPEEYEKMQNVPVGFTAGVAKSNRRTMLGNGWTIGVISHILSNLKKCS